MSRHGSLAEQLEAALNNPQPRKALKAANDNRPRNAPAYRGTLPALRWLYDNHPHLAPALASAIPRPASNWFIDVDPSKQEIRPTVGELMKACHDENEAPITPVIEGNDTTIGKLKFRDGLLVEWGATKKGKKLKPTDRPRTAGDKTSGTRSGASYIAVKHIPPSEHDAEHYHRPFSDDCALLPMYDPLPGVEAARALLVSLGVDGSVPASALPYHVTFGPTVIAEGAGFLGGMSNPSGGSSSGAAMWEAPEDRKSDVVAIIEEIAARGTLKSIGALMGYEGDAAIREGKLALLRVAKVLAAANDNQKKSIARQFSR